MRRRQKDKNKSGHERTKTETLSCIRKIRNASVVSKAAEAFNNSVFAVAHLAGCYHGDLQCCQVSRHQQELASMETVQLLGDF